MFLLIYIWFCFINIVSFLSNFLQKLYWINEQPTILFSRFFYNLGFLEKLFLSLFYRDDNFNYSVANVTREKDIFDYRQKKYPTIFCYHIFLEKFEYENKKLTELLSIYNFFRKSIFFKKFIYIKNKFDIKPSKLIFFDNFMFFLILDDVVKEQFYSNINYLYFDIHDNDNRFDYLFIIFVLLLKCKKNFIFFI